MTPIEIEARVFEVDEIRIVIRAPLNSKLKSFPYVHRAPNNTSVCEWVERRIKPSTADLEVVVIDGRGKIPHPLTPLASIRDSYIYKP